jgi:hypothetical protein
MACLQGHILTYHLPTADAGALAKEVTHDSYGASCSSGYTLLAVLRVGDCVLAMMWRTVLQTVLLFLDMNRSLRLELGYISGFEERRVVALFCFPASRFLLPEPLCIKILIHQDRTMFGTHEAL